VEFAVTAIEKQQIFIEERWEKWEEEENTFVEDSIFWEKQIGERGMIFENRSS
jgi:hypothetical protein